MATSNRPKGQDEPVPKDAPGSPIVIVVGVVAIVSMIFGFLIGLLF
jgi:hypothetical protein